MTAAETMLWRALRSRGIAAKFRRQAPIDPTIVDFLSVDAKLVVEIDGVTHSSEEEIACDKRRDAFFARSEL